MTTTTMISASAYAKRHKIGTERVRQLCKEGRIEGAEKKSIGTISVWQIPEPAKDPRKPPGRPRSRRIRMFKPIVISPAAKQKYLEKGRKEAARIIAEMKEKGVTIQLFGSMKTGKALPRSDIDLLVMDCGPLSPERLQYEIGLLETSIPVDVTFLQFVPQESLPLIMESLHG